MDEKNATPTITLEMRCSMRDGGQQEWGSRGTRNGRRELRFFRPVFGASLKAVMQSKSFSLNNGIPTLWLGLRFFRPSAASVSNNLRCATNHNQIDDAAKVCDVCGVWALLDDRVVCSQLNFGAVQFHTSRH